MKPLQLPDKKEWKLKIFRREGFDEYLNMSAFLIKKILRNSDDKK